MEESFAGWELVLNVNQVNIYLHKYIELLVNAWFLSRCVTDSQPRICYTSPGFILCSKDADCYQDLWRITTECSVALAIVLRTWSPSTIMKEEQVLCTV